MTITEFLELQRKAIRTTRDQRVALLLTLAADNEKLFPKSPTYDARKYQQANA